LIIAHSMHFKLEQIKKGETTIYLLFYNPFNPSDYLDRLTSSEQERYATFRHPKRRMEFVATRILRHDLFGFEHIHYDENGAPFIEQEGYISVSHCNGVVGIALNPHYQIGLDLEIQRSSIHLLAHKYLSEHERNTFDVSDPKVLTQIWSAKEALYKLAGRKKVIFARDLLLESREGLDWSARIINADHDRIVKLHIFDHNDMIVTINSEPIRHV
jgi:4'-phosphopantetheinyl transferase EntD